MKEIEIKLREALRLVNYLEIETEEEQERLSQLALELSRRIKRTFGEVPIWFLANRILRAIEDAKIRPKEKNDK